MRAWQRSDATTKSSMSSLGLLGFLGLFAGLCTIFALVATSVGAWQEHVRQEWPAATATIQNCSLDPYLRKRVTYWHVACSIGYLANGVATNSKVRSRNTTVDMEIHAMNLWTAQHGRGSEMEIHYDPADAEKVVLASTDMPMAGPQTPNNLRVLLFAFVACVVLLTTARVLNGRTLAAQPVTASKDVGGVGSSGI
jgi:hypothetical protein